MKKRARWSDHWWYVVVWISAHCEEELCFPLSCVGWFSKQQSYHNISSFTSPRQRPFSLTPLLRPTTGSVTHLELTQSVEPTPAVCASTAEGYIKRSGVSVCVLLTKDTCQGLCWHGLRLIFSLYIITRNASAGYTIVWVQGHRQTSITRC